LSSDDLLNVREEQGKTASESNTVRRLQPFIDSRSQLPNLRGLAYSSAGFGPVNKTKEQFAYVDYKNQAIPIQAERPETPLRGLVSIKTFGDKPVATVFSPSLPASATPRYYSADPISQAVQGVPELLRAVKRTPASLLPGAADLIPSPEAIGTGYTQGPAAMGKQMAQEFIQSLPAAAGAAAALATPVAAPFAPGIGGGMVGIAGARALNEVVKQETGEGIIPKLRQFIGTAPRTGLAAKPSVGPKPLYAQIKPMTASQKIEAQRQANRNELQRRVDLMRERFNPRKGEFGVSEFLFGR
jgi:hypothetical protein